MNENKQQVCEKLLELLNMTRAGEDIIALTYTKDEHNEEYVTIQWGNGYRQPVCVTADSGIALIRDVTTKI